MVPAAGLTALAPELAVGTAAFLVLVADTFSREKRGVASLFVGFAGIAVAFVTTAYHLSVGTEATLLSGAIVVDGFALFFGLGVLVVTALVLTSSTEYVGRVHPNRTDGLTEYVALVLFAATGMLLMASARSLVTAFLALELAALPSYALVAFAKDDEAGVEGEQAVAEVREYSRGPGEQVSRLVGTRKLLELCDGKDAEFRSRLLEGGGVPVEFHEKRLLG